MAIFTSYWGQSLPLYEGATQLLNHLAELSQVYYVADTSNDVLAVIKSQKCFQRTTLNLHLNTYCMQMDPRAQTVYNCI
jgi:hypothetical protein